MLRTGVSIHAFRGEGDGSVAGISRPGNAVSIHAFRGEGDAVFRRTMRARGVSIHAFRGEGDAVFRRNAPDKRVSIHAFRGEGDMPRATITRGFLGFNPRLPGGRRLHVVHETTFRSHVSIHAFRGEGD